jgi:hypothetical protein
MTLTNIVEKFVIIVTMLVVGYTDSQVGRDSRIVDPARGVFLCVLLSVALARAEPEDFMVYPTVVTFILSLLAPHFALPSIHMRYRTPLMGCMCGPLSSLMPVPIDSNHTTCEWRDANFVRPILDSLVTSSFAYFIGGIVTIIAFKQFHLGVVQIAVTFAYSIIVHEKLHF